MFEKSPRNVRLLKFLVEQALTKKDVNEYIVGFELFEHNYKPDKNDSKVRVYMYNLRKKLEEYYSDHGAGDALIFRLEKGQYNLKFEERKTEPDANSNTFQEKRSERKKMPNKLIFGVVGVVFFVIGVVWFAKSISRDLYCWNDFLGKASNICIMADHTIVWKPKGKRLMPTIEQNINSRADYISYLQKHPEDSIQLADYTLFSKMAPFSIKRLTEWFIEHKANFSLRLETRFEMDETRDNNLIYIGQFKTMSTSRAIFLKGSKVFSLNSILSGFIVTKENEKIEYTAKFNKGIRVEYALVSYLKLDNGKKALFFVSNNDIGVMATVNNFTNEEWLIDFYKKIPANKNYFNALFEVGGMNRTETDCKLIELEVLD